MVHQPLTRSSSSGVKPSSLARFREEMDALFDRFMRDWPDFDRLWKGWPTRMEQDFGLGWGFDIDDRENEIVVRAEAPGFEPGDFDVRVSGNHLVIQAEHKQESKRTNGFSYRYGTFRRMLPLPKGVEEEKIEAQYRNGILEVTVPKGEEAKARRITVKVV